MSFSLCVISWPLDGKWANILPVDLTELVEVGQLPQGVELLWVIVRVPRQADRTRELERGDLQIDLVEPGTNNTAVTKFNFFP